ncbi:hypothetical protein [uncultured Variovorax sp.]|jgi:hypothetical protein|uniref:hypothetical protein n=1 Tax=uncultured Variovorax sp. TaxID=114708 RepID=UPI002608B4FA|nr:hypothetical protein [uncultured Variovorax sp.]
MSDPSTSSGSSAATALTSNLGGRRLPADGPWRFALSADRRWALVCDADGRNLAEVHRPALGTGPIGRPLTFEQVVRLMGAAPDLLALLQETMAPGGIGPHEFSRRGGYRDRAHAVLAMLQQDGIG